MLTDIVLAGEKVELKASDHLFAKEGEGVKVYTSKVYDIISEDKIEIIMPMEKTKLILLPIDGEYDITFYSEKGLYQCYARIVDRYKSNNVYVLAFEVTSNLRKQQRREYYRFSCVMDMKSRELRQDEVDSLNEAHPIFSHGLPLRRSIICDISGGGMRFITGELYEQGGHVYCTFTLNIDGRDKSFDIFGKVLYAKEVDNRPGEYEHRIQYENLSRDSREDIIKFIFDEERRLRRNKRK